MLFLVLLLVVVLCGFPFFGFAGVGLSIACIFMGATNFWGCSFLSRSFCRTGFVLNLVFSWSILFSHQWQSSLGWYSQSLSVCRMSVQDLLAYKLSVEKLSVIMICLPLYSS